MQGYGRVQGQFYQPGRGKHAYKPDPESNTAAVLRPYRLLGPLRPRSRPNEQAQSSSSNALCDPFQRTHLRATHPIALRTPNAIAIQSACTSPSRNTLCIQRAWRAAVGRGRGL